MSDPTPYAACGGTMTPLGGDECLLITDDNQREVMTLDVLAILDQCERFASLEQHRDQIVGAQPQLAPHAPAIAALLEDLATRGLLRSAEQTLQRWQAHGDAEQATPPELLLTRTCDRPDQLARLLSSANEAGWLGDLIVVDDSRQDDSVKRNAATVAAAARSANGTIRLLGRNWRTAAIKKCARTTGIDASALHWLLTGADAHGFAGGGAWNAVTLLGAGKRYAYFDDDIVLKARTWADHEPGWSTIDSGFVTQSWADTESMNLPVAAGDLSDWLGAIGRSVAGHLSAQSIKPAQLLGQSLRALDELYRGGQIAQVICGVYQHLGAPDLLPALLSPDLPRSDWIDDRKRYLQWLASPVSAHGPTQATLAAVSHYVPNAIDGRSLLAPTLPGGRGEDQTFAVFNRFLEPQRVTLQQPIMFHHQRPRWQQPPFDVGRPLSPGRFVAQFIGQRAPLADQASPTARLELIAALLADLTANSAALRNYLDEYRTEQAGQMIAALKQAIEAVEGEPPVHWLADVKSLLNANVAALNAPLDEVTGLNVTAWRDLLGQFAQSLRSWPIAFDWAANNSKLQQL